MIFGDSFLSKLFPEPWWALCCRNSLSPSCCSLTCSSRINSFQWLTILFIGLFLVLNLALLLYPLCLLHLLCLLLFLLWAWAFIPFLFDIAFTYLPISVPTIFSWLNRPQALEVLPLFLAVWSFHSIHLQSKARWGHPQHPEQRSPKLCWTHRKKEGLNTWHEQPEKISAHCWITVPKGPVPQECKMMEIPSPERFDSPSPAPGTAAQIPSPPFMTTIIYQLSQAKQLKLGCCCSS